MTNISPIGICLLNSKRYNQPNFTRNSQYITEILEHAGISFAQLQPRDLGQLPTDLRILITVGEMLLEEPEAAGLREWVKNGGNWISLSSVCGLSDVHGVENVPSPGYDHREFVYSRSTLGEGYLRPTAKHPVLDHLNINLHYYNGALVKVTSPNAKILATTQGVHQQETNHPALVESTFGKGNALFLAPDAVGAVVRISHGTYVSGDGIPAPDGTVPISEEISKCDDGVALDWDFDRQDVPDHPGLKGFFEPVADQWREIILRSIFYFAQKAEISLPLLWLYPRNLPAVAHLSHDTDGNDPELGAKLLEEVNKAEIHSTWCIILDGRPVELFYPPQLIEQISNDGHELATHYNAVDHPWDEEEFISQVNRLKVLLGNNLISNKNHYTCWGGVSEFYDWCKRQGIQLDQSRGPSKYGEVGFTFGSAQLYFPLGDNGKIHSVLEMPLHTQDIVITAPYEIIPEFLDAVEKHHGVMHVLFHPAHIAKDGVADSLHKTINDAKARGLEWFTARQLNDWERSRRGVKLQSVRKNAAAKVLLSGNPLPADSTVLVLGHHKNVEIGSRQYTAEPCKRWGFDFSAVTVDAP